MRGFVATFLMLLAMNASAMQVISERPNPTCEVLPLKRPISIYQDPGLFLSDLSLLLYLDPKANIDEVFKNKPLRRQLRVNEPVMRLGGPFELHDDLYRVLSEPSRLWLREMKKKGPIHLITIKTCGETGDPFGDEPGFIRQDELTEAMKVAKEEIKGMPPSIAPNDIPVYVK